MKYKAHPDRQYNILKKSESAISIYTISYDGRAGLGTICNRSEAQADAGPGISCFREALTRGDDMRRTGAKMHAQKLNTFMLNEREEMKRLSGNNASLS